MIFPTPSSLPTVVGEHGTPHAGTLIATPQGQTGCIDETHIYTLPSCLALRGGSVPFPAGLPGFFPFPSGSECPSTRGRLCAGEQSQTPYTLTTRSVLRHTSGDFAIAARSTDTVFSPDWSHAYGLTFPVQPIPPFERCPGSEYAPGSRNDARRDCSNRTMGQRARTDCQTGAGPDVNSDVSQRPSQPPSGVALEIENSDAA